MGRLNETSTWPLLARSANGYVSPFGELTGLRLDRSPKRLEVVPYIVGDLKTQPSQAPNPLSKATDPTISGGMDLKYALGPGLTLTATINPDFGQVEADPAEVNLSAFESFFSERRPFFVEGSGIFQTNSNCDGDCGAPGRSALDERLGPGALRNAVEIPAQLPVQPESMGGMERGWRSPPLRAERQRPLTPTSRRSPMAAPRTTPAATPRSRTPATSSSSSGPTG